MQLKGEGTEAQRHEGTKVKKCASACGLQPACLACLHLRASVPSCLRAFHHPAPPPPPPSPHFPLENQPFSARTDPSPRAFSPASATGTTAHKLRDPSPTPPTPVHRATAIAHQRSASSRSSSPPRARARRRP